MDTQQASRFIYVSEFVHDGRVEKEAFMPPENPRPYETSVILHNGDDIDWGVGRRIGLGRKNQRQLVGTAEFSERDAVLSELRIEPAPSSISQNHVNLKGWDETDKLRRIAQAEMISMRSDFWVAPEQGKIER